MVVTVAYFSKECAGREWVLLGERKVRNKFVNCENNNNKEWNKSARINEKWMWSEWLVIFFHNLMEKFNETAERWGETEKTLWQIEKDRSTSEIVKKIGQKWSKSSKVGRKLVESGRIRRKLSKIQCKTGEIDETSRESATAGFDQPPPISIGKPSGHGLAGKPAESIKILEKPVE